MKPITPTNAFYVKLGSSGKWEHSSIAKDIVRVGWKSQTLQDINQGKWARIQQKLEREMSDKGAATRDCRALRMLCESGPGDVWITFYKNCLWWSQVTDPAIYEDKTSKYRKVGGWHSQDVSGEPLLITRIPGRISKLQGFRGTICRVKEVEELKRLINGEKSPEYATILSARGDLCRKVAAALGRLHWKDFETLVDLAFSATGWRRISVLGETMKFSDAEYEDSINMELYQVQVKSAASFRDFRRYAQDFPAGKYRKLFFVVHTPDGKLAKTKVDPANQVQLVLPNRLSEMVVDLGLVNWLLSKVR